MTLDELEGASKGNPALRRVLQQVQDWMTGVEKQTGTRPLAGAVSTFKPNPPALAKFTVTAVGSNFVIQITNPPGVIGVLHQLIGATTIPIQASTNIIMSGPAPDLQVVIPNPATTRYWQLRSKFQNSDYNDPQVGGPATTV